MVTGAVQLSMARARVMVDGVEMAKRATVTIVGNEAVALERGANVALRMKVARIDRTRRSATVVGEDGTTWTLERSGCGCGR